MIIDEIILSGISAYLKTESQETRLSAGMTGTSPNVGEGESIDVSGIDLLLNVDEARKLFQRANGPLFEVRLIKEMFPNLYLDPYEHRVVQVSGFEDFGTLSDTNMISMEIDGVPTLVSPGDEIKCHWLSAKYPLASVSTIDGIAWDLAATTKTPNDNFTYDVTFYYWTENNGDLSDATRQKIPLTRLEVADKPFRPDMPRHVMLDSHVDIIGYQLEFSANVFHDAQIIEQHGLISGNRSLGTPLLQAIYVLEKTELTHRFHSLNEAILFSSSYHFVDPSPPLQQMAINLDIEATLTRGELIELAVTSDEIKFLEARLDGMIRRRPSKPNHT